MSTSGAPAIRPDAARTTHGHRKITSHLGMRGVAATAVVMYHIGFVISFHFAFERRNFIFGRSYLFVDLFFILSGFIIAYANQADRPTPTTSREVLKFLKNRFARIYPLHFVCLYALVLCTLVLSLEGAVRGKQTFASYWPAEHVTALAAQTALIQSLGPSDWIDWNIPSWSISAEVFSYLAFVALVALRHRCRAAQTILLIAIPLLFYAYILTAGRSLDIINGIAPLRCLAGFALGMLAFYGRHWLRHLSDPVVNIVQIAGAAIALGALAGNWNDLWVIPAFTILVYSTWSDRGLLSRLLSTAPAQYLGEISYSIYLTHVPVISALGLLSFHLPPYSWLSVETGHAIFIVVVFMTVFLVSRLTYAYVERAGRGWVLRAFAPARHNPVLAEN